jgi:hypothetical protein
MTQGQAGWLSPQINATQHAKLRRIVWLNLRMEKLWEINSNLIMDLLLSLVIWSKTLFVWMVQKAALLGSNSWVLQSNQALMDSMESSACPQMTQATVHLTYKLWKTQALSTKRLLVSSCHDPLAPSLLSVVFYSHKFRQDKKCSGKTSSLLMVNFLTGLLRLKS